MKNFIRNQLTKYPIMKTIEDKIRIIDELILSKLKILNVKKLIPAPNTNPVIVLIINLPATSNSIPRIMVKKAVNGSSLSIINMYSIITHT
ncbi:MAG: hypothetical protein QXP72_02550 [Desulfurococcaceae archaeon]